MAKRKKAQARDQKGRFSNQDINTQQDIYPPGEIDGKRITQEIRQDGVQEGLGRIPENESREKKAQVNTDRLTAYKKVTNKKEKDGELYG